LKISCQVAELTYGPGSLSFSGPVIIILFYWQSIFEGLKGKEGFNDGVKVYFTLVMTSQNSLHLPSKGEFGEVKAFMP
jgi:hypothetical protein